jgi:hypothetical protein
MNHKRYIAALSAVLCLCGAVSCGGSSSSSSSGTSPVITPATVAGKEDDTKAENEEHTHAEHTSMSDEDYQQMLKKINESENSAEPLKFGTMGELHEPAATDKDYELGSYYEGPDGIKYYYNKDEFPDELVMTLGAYFRAYADADYETYSRCLYPSYLEEMNKFLEKDYGYDLKQSFASQCKSLKNQAGGDFTVTRIKLEKNEGELSKFFEYPSACFGKDYYSEVKGETDNIYESLFFVIADDGDEEGTLVSENVLVFAEKDGKYYIFG